ncbi:hypothetical protein C0991_006313 [Blastosporella zonata]|nr:hypothetical protein C0991_006313 [Blastosporella zonata]
MDNDDRLSKPQLQHLKPDGKPSIVITSGPSFFIKVAKDGADARKALVENVDLATQLLTLKTKTQPKEKNTKEQNDNKTPDVAPVAGMGAIMDQLKLLTEQLAKLKLLTEQLAQELKLERQERIKLSEELKLERKERTELSEELKLERQELTKLSSRVVALEKARSPLL